MEEHIQVELLLRKRDVEKLVELAGGEEEVTAYLSGMIRRSYAYRTAFGTELNLENMLKTAHALERKNEEYVATVEELQRRLKQLTTSQEELRATVAFLRSAMFDLGNSTAQRGLH